MVAGETALGRLDEQLMLPEQLKDQAQVFEMFLHRLTEDQDIVKKNDDKLADVLTENGIHEALKSGRRVGEPERHDPELEVAMVSLEGGFIFILLPHADLMVTRTQVQLGEDCCASQFVEQLVHDG